MINKQITRSIQLIYSIIISSTILIIDQLSKYLVVELFKDYHQEFLKVNDILNISLVFNRGITFGMFSKYQHAQWIFSIIGIITVFFLIKWLKDSSTKIQVIALSLIIGGAIGNIIDRIYYGAVVDFLDFHYHQSHWHTFNIADSAICLGVGLLLINNINKDLKTNKINNKYE